MFLILIIEYSGKRVLEFIHPSCSIGLLRKKKEELNDFSDNTWRHCVLMQIEQEILRSDPDCKIQTHFGGGRKLFWEEWTLGTDSTLNLIKELSVNSIFVFLEILCFKIRLLIYNFWTIFTIFWKKISFKKLSIFTEVSEYFYF